MKKQYLFIIFIFSFLQQSFSQNPLVKMWDYRFGGDNEEWLYSVQQTNDGGYILGGASLSDVSGDKTQACWGSYDFWIVKINAAGIKQWDKRFGGTNGDILLALKQTADGGFLLGGETTSGIGGDKSQPSWGYQDFWIVKTDSLGNKQWDKRFGGSNSDELLSLAQTKDGNYILGGVSNSGVSGDKTQPSWGNADYWIIKIDSAGNKIWDKRYGGNSYDGLYFINQTSDDGYVLGGYTRSGISGDKTQPSWGSYDHWIVKIDSIGNKQWDKRFGGDSTDYLLSMNQTFDKGFILGGHSISRISGDKTQDNWDTLCNPHCTYDYWIVKIDSAGNKQWDRDFGGTDKEDEFGNVSQTSDGGYLIAGTSYSPISGDKTETNLGVEQTWIVKIDSAGIKQWDKTVFTTGHEEQGLALNAMDGCYLFANNTFSGIGGYKTQPSWGYQDFWIIKFCDSTATTSITQLSQLPQSPFTIYPNPADDHVTINYQFKAGDEIQLTDALGKLLFTTKIKTPSSDFLLPTSDLSPGIYFLKAGNEVRKFVKE